MRIIVARGSNAGAISAYLHRVDKRQTGKEQDDPCFHTNMFGRDAGERTEELRFSADLNQQVEKTYIHYKISFPPGENPDLETKKGIVDDVLELRHHGQNCQFFAIEHHEKVDRHDVHHLHVLSSSVRLDGTWIEGDYERIKLKDVEREIELKRGLIHCPLKEKGERDSSSIREVKLREKLETEGKILIKDHLRTAINNATKDNPSMSLFVARVKAQGYEVQFHEFENGKGISYQAEGRSFRGRNLGDRYSFEGLHQYAGIDYQPERDDSMLRQLNQMDSQQCRAILNQSQSQQLDWAQLHQKTQQLQKLNQAILEEQIEHEEKRERAQREQSEQQQESHSTRKRQIDQGRER